MKRKHQILFRINEDENNVLIEKATTAGVTPNAYARDILLQSLVGYDQKQAAIMRNIDNVNDRLLYVLEQLEHVATISSLAAAAGTLPLDYAQQDMVHLRQKLTDHFKASSSLAKNISELVRDGKL